jgi:transposase-like protein
MNDECKIWVSCPEIGGQIFKQNLTQFMAKQQKTIVRYSISFKQKVVKEIEEEGLSHSETMRRYGIRGASTINNWLMRFGKNHLLNKVVRVEMKGEKDRLKELEAQVKKLKIALADATLAKDALETLIEVVNEYYETDVKKNLGQKQSNGPQNKKGTE